VKLVCAIVVAVLVSGCASRHVIAVEAPDRPATVTSKRHADDSLETFIQKVRKISVEARPVQQRAATLEGQDAALSSALAASILSPDVASYRRVASEYRRLGVFDRAFQYLGRALALSPHDGSTFEALARLWRDAGLPGLALGDAHRAVFFAPDSPGAHNTLGTVLQSLGKRTMARSEYEKALRLDPRAAFALNNLCYGWILDGEGSQAISACQRALEIEPNLAAATNNLALAYALEGDVATAKQTFARTGDEASAAYNTGIAYLARRDYRSAMEAFQKAHATRPTMNLAGARARQSADALARAGE